MNSTLEQKERESNGSDHKQNILKTTANFDAAQSSEQSRTKIQATEGRRSQVYAQHGQIISIYWGN